MNACATSPGSEPGSTQTAPKACSGKCLGGCGKPLKSWVIAGCGGYIALFEKTAGGSDLTPVEQNGKTFSPSVEAFSGMIRQAMGHEFDTLILVGSREDIAWLHLSLPIEAAGRVLAEIQHPLKRAWFSGGTPQEALRRALTPLLT